MDFTLKTSSRARRISITIKNGQVTVTMPVGATAQQALSFLESKKVWLAKHLTKCDQIPSAGELVKSDEHQLLYLGKWHRVEVATESTRSIQIQLIDDRIIISLTKVPATADQLNKALDAWYREQAVMVCGEKLHHFSKIMGLTLQEYRIKEQQTRWGSCSTRNNININWRILLAPEAVVDYLIVHELAHLRQMNHSREFWLEVEKVLPGYCQEKKWLRVNGTNLMQYVPATCLF